MSKKKQKEQKKKQRQERIRREKHERRTTPRLASDQVTEEFHDQFDMDEPPVLRVRSRAAAEQELRKLHAAIAAAGIEDEAQLQEFMIRYNAGEITGPGTQSLEE